MKLFNKSDKLTLTGVIPLNRDKKIKRLNNLSMYISENWINISNDTNQWTADNPCPDITWMEPCLCNDIIVTISKNSNKIASVDTTLEDKFITLKDLPLNGPWVSTAFGKNTLLMAKEFQLLKIETDNHGNLYCYKSADFSSNSQFPIEKLTYINNKFILFFKNVPIIGYSDKEGENWKIYDFRPFLGENWFWTDIILYKDQYICLNSESNQLLVMNQEFKDLQLFNIVSPGENVKWENLSCNDTALTISCPFYRTLITTTLNDWGFVIVKHGAPIKTISDEYGNRIDTVKASYCRLIPIVYKQE